jgi:hypothetical protein
MLDAATMKDPTLNLGVRRRGQDTDHHQSPHGGSASSISTSRLEHNQGCSEEDPQDVHRTKDAQGQIENHRQDRDGDESERRKERDFDLRGPYYNLPTRRQSLARGQNTGGIKLFSHDLRKVCWPQNFKTS